MKKENFQNYKKKGIKLFPQILLVILLLFTTSCGKQNFDEKLFTETVEKNNFVVAELPGDDRTEFLAVSSHYQISLYAFETKKDCKNAFKVKLKEYKDKNSNIKSKKNYYAIENSNVYTLIYKIDNYYIEVEAPKTYKKEIINLLKEMGLDV